MNRKTGLYFGIAAFGCALLAIALTCLKARPGGLRITADEPPPKPADAPKPAPAPPPENPWKDEPPREPAVAGAFYPGDKDELARMIQGFLDKASGERIENVRGLVCPHAGYQFSGQTAAFAYKQLIGRTYRTVIVMSPSHHSLFEGAYIAPVSGYKTPLGVVPLSGEAALLAKAAPFSSKPQFQMARPQWAKKAETPRPDQYEHSLEVQVPFLQQTLKDFALVPIVFGEVDPAAVAKALRERIDAQTLIVASSDLSHFHADAEARELDAACVKAICDLDVTALKKQEACGKAPVLALLELARQNGWKAKLLDCRNSSAVTGDKTNVVGYAAIAFFDAGGSGMAAAGAAGGGEQKALFGADERTWMLDLARRTLTEVVNGRAAPELIEKDVPEKIRGEGACFVTLTMGGQLRGCIGHIVAVEPLYKSVRDNAQHAALEDYRFPTVRPEELKKIHIEISVLTKPEPLAFKGPDDLLKKLQPHKDGVVLKVGGRGATFLPQVWEQLPDKEEFLSHLSQKAGMPAQAWREPGTQVSIYHVEAFEEEKK